MFCFFYMPDPALRAETAGTGQFNRLVVQYLMGSSAYAGIRHKTVLDFDAAVAPAERFGQMFADYLHSGTLGAGNASRRRRLTGGRRSGQDHWHPVR